MADTKTADFQLESETLDSGLKIISNNIPDSETVAIAGSMKAGAICDEPGMLGTAELASRLLMRGTKSRSGAEISQQIEELGATLTFENRDEVVYFTARCHHQVLEEVLRTIADCLNEPSFPEDQIDVARGEILAEIKSEEDDTRSVAYKGLASLIYGDDAPYGRDTLGKPEDLGKITRKDLAEFHDANYGASRMVLAITGSFELDRLKEILDGAFAHFNGNLGRFPPRGLSESPIVTTGEYRREMQHKSQVDLALGSRAVARTSQSYYPLSLGNLILGRLGLYGRLGKNVREERGVAYYSYSAVQAKLFSGNIGIYAGVNPKNVEKALSGIAEEVSRITTEEIPEEELRKARRNAVGSLWISMDTSIERVGVLHDIEYYGLGLDFLARYPKILAGVSSKDVRNSFAKYLDRISISAAGPLGNLSLKLPKQLQSA